jgi:uncharacterized protein (TIGR02246 family)
MPQSATVANAFETIEPGILEIFAIHEKGWNEKDSKLLLSLFDEQFDFVNVLGVHHRGAESFGHELHALFTTIMRNSKIRIPAHDVRMLIPEVAVAHSHWEMTGVERVPRWNVPELRRGVMTYVLAKRAGKWKIVAAQNTDVIDLKLPK